MAGPLRLCVLVLASYYSVSLAAEEMESNSFVVEVQGGRDRADEIAAKYDFINMGQVSIPASSSILPFLIDWQSV